MHYDIANPIPVNGGDFLVLPLGWTSESVALSHHRRLSVLLFIHRTDLHCSWTLHVDLNWARTRARPQWSAFTWPSSIQLQGYHITIHFIVGQWVKVEWIVEQHWGMMGGKKKPCIHSGNFVCWSKLQTERESQLSGNILIYIYF